MEEQFDLIDEHDQPLGISKARSAVHRDGDWHRAVDIWIINSNGEVLIQKRAPQKESFPNLWDSSCAGHISAGEESLPSAVRELEEELGIIIQPPDLKFLFTVKEQIVTNDGAFINNEYKDTYLLQGDFAIDSLNLQSEEVSEAKWIPLSALQGELQEKPQDFVPHPETYEKLFEHLLPAKHLF